VAAPQLIALFSPKTILDSPRKITVIRLRWLVVIICAYLLLFSPDPLLKPIALHGVVLGYLLTGIVLYFLPDRLFDDSLFYSPMVIFDTLFITASLVITRQVATDFYLTYFLVIILCAVWKDLRWSVSVTTFIALLYGYFLLRDAQLSQSSIALRIPFLFVVSIFYGYFVQIVHVERMLRMKAEEEAVKDSLTGLLTRRAFEQRLAEEFERAQRYERPLSVLMLDIDNFKIINDTYGHLWGDQVLRKLADQLRDTLRQSDLACRYGGEEIVVILPETALNDSIQVAGRIRNKIKEAVFETASGSFSITVSIGVSSTTEKEYTEHRELLSDADRMLYVAKNSGKDWVEFLFNMHRDSSEPTYLQS
jgi:diguanylate cyclase (GGDEF)-like protein